MKLLFALLTILVFSHSLHAVELHLSPRGDDTNDGTTEKPFAKKGKEPPQGGVTVTLHGGLYELTKTFALTAQDADTAEAPVTYHAQKGEEARISDGRRVMDWKPVADKAVLERLDPVARGRLLHGLVHPEMRHIGVPQLAGDEFAGACRSHGRCWEGLCSGPAFEARAGMPAEQLAPHHPRRQREQSRAARRGSVL